MIKFKIAGKSYAIPTSWPDVTYEQYVYHILPRTLTESIHCFTGIPLETLASAKLTNLERISLALSFMTLSPKMERTEIVGPYIMPGDPKLESLAQFEDLRKCVKQYPIKDRKEWDYTDYEKEAEIYLTCCAIYCQKLRDGYYDLSKVESVKDQLRNQSAIEVLTNGGFFLAKAWNISPPSTSLSRRIFQRLKKALRVFPGYQRTLDFLLPSHRQP